MGDIRGLVGPIAVVVVVSGLFGCGSSDSGSNASSTQSSTRSAQGSSGTPSKSSQGTAGLNEKGSSSFIVPGGDNSIPNYGEEASSGELEAAEEVLSAYLAARAAGDWGKSCAYLSTTAKGQVKALSERAAVLKGKGCGATLRVLSRATSAAAQSNTMTNGLASLRVKGDTGFGLYHGSDGTNYTIALVQENGVWKVGALSATEISGPGG